MDSPSIPRHLTRILSKFDPRLAFEWRRDHWCVVDTSSIISYRKIDLGSGYLTDNGSRVAVSLSKSIPRYDVVMHLPRGVPLTTAVIDELNYRRMDRWARKKDFVHHIEGQLEKGEEGRRKQVDDFADFSAHEVAKIARAPESVTINGRKGCP